MAHALERCRAYRRGIRVGARGTAALLGWLLAPPSPLWGQFGELPQGAVQRQALEGVRGELARTVLVDSLDAARYVPRGWAPLTLRAMAARDSVTARYVGAHPELGATVPGRVVFFRLDSLRVDDGPTAPSVSAFWWVPVRPIPSVVAPVPGEAWVEVASWSPDTAFVRAQGGWPPLQRASVVFEQVAEGEWAFSLTATDARIEGRCRLEGRRVAASYALPAFTTVWPAGPEPEVYDVYTYHGHHEQRCAGAWTAHGDHPMVEALRRTPADLPSWAEVRLEDGWHGRSARYRRF